MLSGSVVVSVMKFVMLDLELALYEKPLAKREKGILLKVIPTPTIQILLDVCKWTSYSEI